MGERRKMIVVLFHLLAVLLLSSPSAHSFSLTNHLVASSPRAIGISSSSRTTRLHQSTPSPEGGDGSSSGNEEKADNDDRPDYASEETLLCMDLAVQPGQTLDQAVARVSKFCQSFPFAAVLPVQPLQYVPVYEDGGVEIKFLRKKTDIKSGIDGGVRFFIERPATTQEKDDATTAIEKDSLIEDEDDGYEDDDDEPAIIEIKAKRNSKGQAISKLMSEKLIVTNFVAGITGEETGRFGEPPTDFVQVRSIYHKWM